LTPSASGQETRFNQILVYDARGVLAFVGPTEIINTTTQQWKAVATKAHIEVN
jgi:hypothetical protein